MAKIKQTSVLWLPMKRHGLLSQTRSRSSMSMSLLEITLRQSYGMLLPKTFPQSIECCIANEMR
jgi:hypothetical protein